MKYFIMAMLAAFSLTLAPAFAINYPLRITNETKHHAWVTVWYAYKIHGWALERELCMKPFETWKGSITYNTPELGAQLKVRAELKTGDCRTGNIKDVYDRFDIPTNIHPYPYLGAYIHEGGLQIRASIMPQ